MTGMLLEIKLNITHLMITVLNHEYEVEVRLSRNRI